MQVQVYFLLDRLRELATKQPEHERAPAVQGVSRARPEDDREPRQAGLSSSFFATHAGMTRGRVRCGSRARGWRRAKHPQLGRPFVDCVYQPQLELLDYLRANGFKTFIVTGGGIDLVRAFAEERLRHPARAGDRLEREAAVRSSARGLDSVQAGRARTASTTARRKSRTSACTSAGGRSWRSATRTAISRCCATRRPARAAARAAAASRRRRARVRLRPRLSR